MVSIVMFLFLFSFHSHLSSFSHSFVIMNITQFFSSPPLFLSIQYSLNQFKWAYHWLWNTCSIHSTILSHVIWCPSGILFFKNFSFLLFYLVSRVFQNPLREAKSQDWLVWWCNGWLDDEMKCGVSLSVGCRMRRRRMTMMLLWKMLMMSFEDEWAAQLKK